ncbi:MAG: ABC transporter permease [Bacillota bacterium]
MPKFLVIAGREIKEEFREPTMPLLMVAMALIFTFAVGIMFGGAATDRALAVLVYDNDNSAASQALVADLQKAPGLTMATAEADDPEPEAAVREGSASVAVVIPEGYGADVAGMRAPSITVLGRSDSTDGLVVQQVLGRSLLWTATSLKAADLIAAQPALAGGQPVSPDQLAEARAADLKALDDAWAAGPKVTTVLTEVGTKTTRKANFAAATTQTVAGFVVMFLMYPAVFGAGSILDERQRGTWSRLLTTPTGGLTMVFGQLLGVLVSSWMQAAVIIVATHYLFGVNWGSSVLGLMLVMTSFILSTIGLGLAIAGFVQTKAQLAAVSPILITGTCMIGGAYWPSELMPRFMQIMGKFFPPEWAVRGFNALVQRNGGLADVLGPSLMLLAFAAVFLTIGVLRVRYE